MVTFTAVVAYPIEHLQRATAALRGDLRRQLAAADVDDMASWETLEVTGPRSFTDLRGRTWFEYRATVKSPGPFERSTS